MLKIEMTEKIMAAKASKNISWEDIAKPTGMSPVFITSCCLGMNSATEETAKKICEALDLDSNVEKALAVYPTKVWDQTVPTDPLIYRFYEIMGVYGETLKEVIQEKFQDGIMSAIDFKLDVERKADPKGDRVVVTMDGKFLNYASW